MSTQVAADELYWDPLQHRLNERPYDLYRRLRDEQPVYRNPKFGFYVLSRFDDVLKARLDWKVFSNSHSVQFERLYDPSIPLNFMNDMDPPQHSAVRTVVQREFTPRKALELEAQTRDLCVRMLDRLVGKAEFDFVADFAEPFPFLAICQLLGIDEGHHDTLWSWWVERERLLVQERDHPDLTESNAIETKIGNFLHELAEERRDDPRPDMMTYLVQVAADEDGEPRPLTADEIGQYCRAFFVAGSATTTQLLSWGALLLDENPEQRRKLVAEPELIANAVEEMLRLEPPAPSGGRWLMEDVEMHGVLMPKDSVVMLHTAAASRDDREYADADSMDITRKVRQLAFGHGVHLCLGASLARLEGRIGFEELLRRFPEWHVDSDNAKMRLSSGLRGWKILPFSPV